MMYLGIGLIAVSCFVLGYKLGVYSQNIYLSVVVSKMIENICEKYKLESSDVASVIRSTGEKFKTGEYNAADLFKRSNGR